MNVPRFRFTIRQLIALIAICAVAFALLRTPFAFLVIALGLVLPGFLIERARGGDGILGGALSACLIVCVGAGVVVILFIAWAPSPVRVESLVQVVPFLFFLSLFAFLIGWILSCVLYAIVKRSRTIFKGPPLDESCGPIRWRPLDNGQQERQQVFMRPCKQ